MRRHTNWGPGVYFHDPLQQREQDYADLHDLADDFDMYDMSNDLVC